MRRMAYLIIVSILLFSQVVGQSNTIDRDKVLAFFQNQEFDEAINYLTPFAAADSNNTMLLGYLGFANSMDNNANQAKKYYGRLYSVDSNNLSAIQFLAHTDEVEDSISLKMTRKLIAKQPDKSSNYRHMAELLMKNKQRDSVFLYYSYAYKLLPSDYRNAAGLAGYFLDTKQFSRADSIIVSALTRDTLNIPLLKLSIRSAYEQKDYKRVLLPGERLMRMDETSVSSLTNVALAYYSLQMYKNCIRVCDYLLQHEIELEAVYYYESKAFAKLKDYAKSNELLETCIAKSISKNIEMFYYNLGENHEQLNQYKKAIAMYDTAYYLSKDPLMNYNIGRIYETDLNNYAIAQKYYNKFLIEADPKIPEQKAAYTYVKERLRRPKNTDKKGR